MEPRLTVDILYDQPGGPLAIVKVDGKTQFSMTRGGIDTTVQKLNRAASEIDWHNARLVLAWCYTNAKKHLMFKGQAHIKAKALCGKLPSNGLNEWYLAPVLGPNPPKLADLCKSCRRVWEQRKEA